MALKQLSEYIKTRKLKRAMQGVIEYLEKGQNLATAMSNYPDVFSPLVINVIRIGESTGHLSEAFDHLHHYLEFQLKNVRQIKSALRYPTFVIISITIAIIILNVFVIPSFARFYSAAGVELPWQTRLLVGTSNFFVHDGLYLLLVLIAAGILVGRYIHTPEGKYRWHRLQLHTPVFGELLRRILLIRFCQSLAIILNSGISITDGLSLVKKTLQNSFFAAQINNMQEAIERGNTFTQSLSRVELFNPLEQQILTVGESNGQLGPSLDFIGEFHGNEVEYDLKRLSDLIAPIILAFVAVLILIIALGVYLPIWNLVNVVH